MLLFSYLIRSTIIISILYAVYIAFFNKQKTLIFNRILLIAMVLTGLVGPVLANFQPIFLNNYLSIAYTTVNLNFWLDEITILADNSNQYNSLLSTDKLVIVLYLLVSSVLLVNLITKVIKIINLISKNQKFYNEGFTYIILNNSSDAFSFFNFIFLGDEIYKNTKIYESIIEHEKVHIRQRHSIDILLAEILIIFNWFNPISFLIKKSLSETHEYLADKGSILETDDLEKYKLLLLNNSGFQTINSITHNFSYPLLKKRINMMTQKNSTIKLVLGAIVLPIAFGLSILACNSPDKSDAIPEEVQNIEKTTSDLIVNEDEVLQSEITDGEDVFTVVETMPEYPGGINELYKFLGENIKYPESAKDKGIQGRVFIGFIINKDGSISNVKTLRGVTSDIDEEAMRVVKMMPNWKPGEQRGKKVRVSYTLPIKFSLN